MAVQDPALESDEQLLDRLARRDIDALDQLYSRYGRMAFAIAYRVLGNPEAAEDAVQEAFLAIWRRAASFEATRGNGRTWVLTVVRNRSIDMLRARESRPKGTPLDDVLVLQSSGDDPLELAIQTIDGATVRDAVQSLPVEQRETVELAFFSGLSYPEIANRTKTPLGTVKSRMRLALGRLRGQLAGGM